MCTCICALAHESITHVCVNNRYLVLLLLLLAEVAAVGVIFDNLLAHVIHSVHQKLKALLQVVAGGGEIRLSVTHFSTAISTVAAAAITLCHLAIKLIAETKLQFKCKFTTFI